MSGTRFESPEQTDAFSGLCREHQASAVFVHDLPHHAVAVTLWRPDSDVPVCKAVITAGGHVHTELGWVA